VPAFSVTSTSGESSGCPSRATLGSGLASPKLGSPFVPHIAPSGSLMKLQVDLAYAALVRRKNSNRNISARSTDPERTYTTSVSVDSYDSFVEAEEQIDQYCGTEPSQLPSTTNFETPTAAFMASMCPKPLQH
jgi:hypothetical protein